MVALLLAILFIVYVELVGQRVIEAAASRAPSNGWRQRWRRPENSSRSNGSRPSKTLPQINLISQANSGPSTKRPKTLDYETICKDLLADESMWREIDAQLIIMELVNRTNSVLSEQVLEDQNNADRMLSKWQSRDCFVFRENLRETLSNIDLALELTVFEGIYVSVESIAPVFESFRREFSLEKHKQYLEAFYSLQKTLNFYFKCLKQLDAFLGEIFTKSPLLFELSGQFHALACTLDELISRNGTISFNRLAADKSNKILSLLVS